MRVFFAHGMGDWTDAELADEGFWVGHSLAAVAAETAAPGLPHGSRAPFAEWMPFAEARIAGHEAETIVVGHSSGALLAVRLAEKHGLAGVVLLAGTDNDLGDERERASGFFDTPWDWDAVRRNVPAARVRVLHSRGDRCVPFGDGERVAEAMGVAVTEVDEGVGHFLRCRRLPQLVQVLTELIALGPCDCVHAVGNK